MKLSITDEQIINVPYPETYTIKVYSTDIESKRPDVRVIDDMSEEKALIRCELLQQIKDSGGTNPKDIYDKIDFDMRKIDVLGWGVPFDYDLFSGFWRYYIGDKWHETEYTLDNFSVEYVNKYGEIYKVEIEE